MAIASAMNCRSLPLFSIVSSSLEDDTLINLMKN
ncbi:unnamed protein product [Acanthoscelides obtectus]|uniref:Uncharacterized protein n=1 Tax=Acanthoscelides obtectus TaxID=200917 RepID=A0A9P0M3J7_ACAOB|nr:unnamed protein product [Acanthoscelides obtectus]CAK1629428.1 hypothetical protein AOBTE_LOCUS5738 [Acanthoscelides obtectus]